MSDHIDAHSDEAITERQTRIILLLEAVRKLCIAVLVVGFLILAGGVWLYDHIDEGQADTKATRALICDAYDELDLTAPEGVCR